MASRPTSTSRQVLLSAQEVRELIRDARGSSVPDYVARVLRDRYMEPYEEDAEEIAELLGKLIETARARVEANGIEPLHDEHTAPPKLPKRERDGVANLAMLLGTRSASLLFAGRREDAAAEALEAVAWARAAQDHERLSLAWMALYAIYERLGKWEEQRGAALKAVEEARISGNSELIVDMLLPLISYLIEASELDEAERLNNEVQAILRDDCTEEQRHPNYATSLSHAARIARYRRQDAESILGFREALRWADGTLYPLTRASLLSHLGSSYTILDQHRQCIECQHELVALADTLGMPKVRSWACLNLAEAHKRLEEYDQALELLDLAERYAAAGSWDHILLIMLTRAEVLLAAGRPEEAAVFCRRVIEGPDTTLRVRRLHYGLCMLGQSEEQCSRFESALEHYEHAARVAEREISQNVVGAKIGMARALAGLERYDEAMALLGVVSAADKVVPAREAEILRLRASIAETLGDLHSVIVCERRVAAIERELLEQKAEQSLRSARIMMEVDLLEREAELERDRRRRLDRELANAAVVLGTQTRHAEELEKQLREILARGGAGTERAVVTAMLEALHELRGETQSPEPTRRYLSNVDEEFLGRLRQHVPGLTGKQERLCQLIRAGLDSREIASLLGLQPEGLKALRKRLRKGLGLDQEEPLEKFLANF